MPCPCLFLLRFFSYIFRRISSTQLYKCCVYKPRVRRTKSKLQISSLTTVPYFSSLFLLFLLVVPNYNFGFKGQVYFRVNKQCHNFSLFKSPISIAQPLPVFFILILQVPVPVRSVKNTTRYSKKNNTYGTGQKWLW